MSAEVQKETVTVTVDKDVYDAVAKLLFNFQEDPAPVREISAACTLGVQNPRLIAKAYEDFR